VKRRSDRSTLLPNVFYVLGTLGFVIGSLMALGSARFAASAVHVDGQISAMRTTSIEYGRRGHGHSNTAQVSFLDADGRAHVQTMQVGDGRYVGDAVDVMYPKGQPGRAQLGGFRSQWLLPLLFLVAGLVLVGLGWVRSADETQS
jgi:hypothetical protein